MRSEERIFLATESVNHHNFQRLGATNTVTILE